MLQFLATQIYVRRCEDIARNEAVIDSALTEYKWQDRDCQWPIKRWCIDTKNFLHAQV